MVMTETHIGEIPSFLLAKRVVFLQSSSLLFVFSGYCFDESSKGNLLSILFGGRRCMMLEHFSLEC